MTYSIEAYYRHEHDDEPVVLRADDDVDRLVDALLAESFDHTLAALYVTNRPATEQGYPDHDFRVGVNPERKVGGLKFAGTFNGVKGVWYAVGEASQATNVVYEYSGHPEDFPLDSEISLDQVRESVKRFLKDGGERPDSIEWKAWPEEKRVL
ncbi:Imm1 family immunity protein [Kribbella italica]|uniref:Immunity protein Imm1 n=1 Tax=Kribbella italica TaxID=1540520 RepID=A0A7W9J7V3_9ACTN|nr:Imm1 family immunity protein [Kribbella italica]MBB5836755.1 hypothetical protein [Kribbella italica]